jgi:hypothetical protein
VHRPIRSLGFAAALAVAALGFAAPVAAQSTTTTSTTGVPSIPVTPAVPVTTTTAPAAAAAATTSAPLATTGIAADRLVPLGFLLIGLGSALVAAARRYGRPAFRFL